jgi:hypothetical protein
MLPAAPGNGAARGNGHGPTTGPNPVVAPPRTNGNGSGLHDGINGHNVINGINGINGVNGNGNGVHPLPPGVTPGDPGAEATPPPPPPPATATPLPGSPTALGAPGAPGSGEPSGSTEAVTGAPDSPRRPSRRMWLPALVLAAALLLPTLLVLRPWGSRNGSGRDGGAVVDLRDVGNRTIPLTDGLQPIALLQDENTLWVKSGSPGANAELTKIDLTSGEVVDTVPFPESDSVGTITAGAGSLWVTTSSVETMRGAVVRIDPENGEKIATVNLPVWPGRTVFTAGSLWVATVQQPVVEELGARPEAMTSAANGLSRIDPDTNEVVASISLEATPVDVRAAGNLVLVSTEGPDEAAVVAIDPLTDDESARVVVPAGTDSVTARGAQGPWMLFATDPYAVRVDIEDEAIAAVTGPRDGIDIVVPNGEQMWEIRSQELTVLDEHGDEVVTVTFDGTPLAAAAAGRGAAWVAYHPADSDEVLLTRVPAAELLDLSD